MTNETDFAIKKCETIIPLLNDNLSEHDRRGLRRQILNKTGWSARTLRRHLASYKKEGFEGLKSKTRSDKNSMRSINQKILDYAVELRENEPQLSVDRLIEILVSEEKITRNSVARSTLDRHLRRISKSRRDIKISKQSVCRRFVRVGRNTLWQSDVKYGPTLTGNDKKKIKTYMIAIIDDATRFICHSEFYATQSSESLEDCIRKAILKCGVPGSLYVDNGKIYRTDKLKLACARLGIQHLNTAPYRPEGKGKIEKFNQTAEEFFHSSKLEPSNDLIDLNAKYHIWLEEGYNRRPHSSLEGKTPYETFHGDSKPIRVSTIAAIKKAFLNEVDRKVDKTGCFSIEGILFEAGLEFCNKRIEVHYDSFDLSLVDIYYNAEFKKTVTPGNIGEFCNNKRAVVVKHTERKKSRLLGALSKKHAARIKREGVIFFNSKGEDGDSL